MNLSILHSRKWPSQKVILLITFLCVWGVGAAYTLKVNPEIRLSKFQFDQQARWSRENLTEDQPRFVLFGGSSSAFSISPRQALSNNIQLVNVAMGAGNGPKMLTRLGLLHARPGDVLVMAMETGLLADAGKGPMSGAQLSVALGNPQLCDESSNPSPHLQGSWSPYFWALRPGGHHFFTMLGKFVMGKPMFRYREDGVQPDGRMETEVRLSPVQVAQLSAATPQRLSPAAREWLINLKAYCKEHRLARISHQ